MKPITMTPIGVIRTPFKEKVEAPRQPYAAVGVKGTIELYPGNQYELALCDLESWERVWVLFWFHLVENWSPKVLPPRSQKRRGVLSTRSPHRPNPIGLSVLRLVSVKGLTIEVLDVDIVDQTPILDIKPYVPYADAFPESNTGWITPLAEGESAGADPEGGFEVIFSASAEAQLLWLEAKQVQLREPLIRTLKIGPQKHPYRRIKADGDAMLVAHKEWRARFRVEGRCIEVFQIKTGYREEQLWKDENLAVHQEFTKLFA
jgi:tRNA-Thr(GGU) m(6)t(6)A37 methyltransferase TsaA